MMKFNTSITALVLLLFRLHQVSGGQGVTGFVGTKGSRFILNGMTFYMNGFNAYWMMVASGALNQTGHVVSVMQHASQHGLTVGRTWAFSDAGVWPLQTSPGVYNEAMFKGLDSAVAAAGRNGIRLILSLVNNYPDFGGRKQYVNWARQSGQNVNSDDDFYTNNVVKGYYKNHIKTVLTRINSITNVAYKDDPAIFAWELINEPRCQTDLSGRTFQNWVDEMARYVKSIDSNHMVEIGAEGFYGQSSTPARQALNPYSTVFGTDFILNNQIAGIDFATIHVYPDIWLTGSNSSDGNQLSYMQSWAEAHNQDAAQLIKKPLVIAEFGKSSKKDGMAQRDDFFSSVYKITYGCAKAGGSLSGGLFWQLLDQGMDNLRDGYEVIFAESPTTANIISLQSQRMSELAY